jgi:hypothetical protein
MFFGIGIGELVIILFSNALPIALVALGVKLYFRAVGLRRGESLDDRDYASELREAHRHIDELEARVAQVDEKASFTQDLLDKPRVGQ